MKKRYWIPLALIILTIVAYNIYAMPPSAPDRYIITADTIVTMDPDSAEPEAVLVHNGIIAAVGTLEELKAQSDIKVLHQTGTLVPGLIEPHTHPVAAAMLGAAVDISAITYSNRADIMAALKDAAEKTAITPWLIAYGWDPAALPDLTPPTREELDAISSDRPILILTQMLHDAYVNTAAVEAAGITLAGSLLHETDAVDSVVSKIPPPAPAATELLVRRQYARYAKGGFTSLGVTGAVGRHDDPVGLLRKISIEDGSAARTFVYLIKKHQQANTLGGDLDFQVLGAKYWMDGSPFTGGAATRLPYEENNFVNGHLGIPKGNVTPVRQAAATFAETMAPLHRQGYQISVHTQGERAVDAVLDTFEMVQTAHPMPELHHRLEHNALITKPQMERAAALGVSLGFFVEHIYFYGHILPELFGEDRTARYMPMKTAFGTGLVVTMHGDHPATPIDAMQTMETAVSRTARIGGNKVAQTEAISPYQVLQAMTINAALQLGQEKSLGSIAVGKQADFTLLSGNPLTDDLSSITPLATWKSGQPVDHRMVSWLRPGLVWGVLMSMF